MYYIYMCICIYIYIHIHIYIYTHTHIIYNLPGGSYHYEVGRSWNPVLVLQGWSPNRSPRLRPAGWTPGSFLIQSWFLSIYIEMLPTYMTKIYKDSNLSFFLGSFVKQGYPQANHPSFIRFSIFHHPGDTGDTAVMGSCKLTLKLKHCMVKVFDNTY